MAERFYPLWELTLARLREFYREPGVLFWVFGFPLVLAVGLGIAFRNKPADEPRIAVQADAEWIASALEGSKSVLVQRASLDQAALALRKGKVDLVVLAAPGEGRAVIYRYDPTREPARLARLVTDDALQRASGRTDVVVAREETVSEHGARYVDFLLPGLMGLNLMGSSMYGIGYNVVLQRRRKLLKRLAATPMRRSHFMLAYVLSRLVFLLLEVSALLLFGRLAFDVSVQGSYLAVWVIALVGAASFAGIALLIAARLQSIEVASGWMNFVMMPMWLLSGSLFSYERFPVVVQPFIKALPLTALNDALRAVYNDGVSLAATWPQLGILAGWTVLSLLLAVKTFRWQ